MRTSNQQDVYQFRLQLQQLPDSEDSHYNEKMNEAVNNRDLMRILKRGNNGVNKRKQVK